ncbi:putative RNA polymerase sigma factor [Actinomycetales bacterium JB111]|nr:putative RNA polymerase sigma factor [Actinomycetales bacterium JB111]
MIGILVRRGADFASAEDAVQDALLEALTAWKRSVPSDPKGWLVTVSWRKFLDSARSAGARASRESRVESWAAPGPTEQVDDTLRLYFLCAHPSLSPASAVALTLRAIAGLTTAQIAAAYMVPEATMAQRISRAKRTIRSTALDEPGDVATVLRILYLVFNEGYSSDVDLQAEAIRLTRELRAAVDHPEIDGLLALMLIHHARRRARTRSDGALVPLAEQDRTLWDEDQISAAVRLLTGALAADRPGEFQAQAAIAALHADARSVEETDWPQIVEWYDELLRFTDTPLVRLNRAVALGEWRGPDAAFAELESIDPDVPRHAAVRGHFLEAAGEYQDAARAFREAADRAQNTPERDHLLRRAARATGARGAPLPHDPPAGTADRQCEPESTISKETSDASLRSPDASRPA